MYSREAFSLCPIGHPECPTTLNNFANALFVCYEQIGETKDLEEMITCHCEALALCPPGHEHCSMSLNVMTSNYRIINSQSQRIVCSEV